MYKIENMPTTIDIGFTGEESFRKVEIDMTAWMALVPGGTPSIVCIRPGEDADDAYLAETTFVDNILTWTVTQNDLGAVEGAGVMQVWLEKTQNTTLQKRGKSIVVSTYIHGSINDPGDTIPPARTALLNLTAEAESLDADEQPTAEWEHDGYYGDYNLKLGIPSGTTFTPSVDASGNISWTNDGGKTNPTTMNIKGPQGDPAPDELVISTVNTKVASIITNPDSPPLDRSLTSSSSATPADITGDLKSALYGIMPDIDFEMGSFSTTGVEVADTKAMRSIDKISVRILDTVTCESGYEFSVWGWDGDSFKGKWNGTGYVGTSATWFTSLDCTTIRKTGITVRFLFRKTAQTTIQLSEKSNIHIKSAYVNYYDYDNLKENVIKYYGYPFATDVSASADLNTYKTFGVYTIPGSIVSGLSNRPFGYDSGGGILIVRRMAADATSFKYQEIYNNAGKHYYRFWNNSTWSEWVDTTRELQYKMTATLSSKMETFLALNSTKKYVNMLVCTDTHANEKPTAIYAIDAYNTISQTNSVDVCVHCGDVVTGSISDIDDFIKDLEEALNKFKNPEKLRILKGNHEIKDEGTRISLTQSYILYDMNRTGSVVHNPNDPFTCYYYQDFEAEKVRAIFLDTYSLNLDNPSSHNDNVFGIDATQLAWIYNTALDVQDEWTVVVFAHYFDNTLTSCINIFKAFINRGTAYGGYSFNDDITTHFAGVIHGHQHMDDYSDSLGFNRIGIRRSFATDWGFDLFTLDTDNKTLYATRIGNGSSRTFTYD